MRNTEILNTKEYVDLIAISNRLFLFRRYSLTPLEITDIISKVEIVDGEECSNLGRTLSHGLIGTLVLGPIGTIIGITTTPERYKYTFRIQLLGYDKVLFIRTKCQDLVEVLKSIGGII